MLQSKYITKEETVTHSNFNWKARDGKTIYAQYWHAGENMKAAILLIHGLGEHSSRYDNWSKMFAKEGISVLTFDLRGHGKTPGKPADTYDYNKFLEDIDLLVEHGKEMFKDKPLFLYGHSFGGNLTVNYAISRQLDINGLILTSPWFELSSMPPRYKVLAAKLISRILPGIRGANGLKAENLSRELRVVHNYRNDPLVHDKITVGLFRKTYENGLIAKRSIYKINVPLLLLHGTADNITSVRASREFVMNSGTKTKFVEIEGAYHELHNDNDSDREKVFKIILDWLSEHIKQ